jgi:hypothetical protein
MSAKKTMDTTWRIYVPRAEELRLFRLKLDLIFDSNRERAAFIKEGLIVSQVI